MNIDGLIGRLCDVPGARDGTAPLAEIVGAYARQSEYRDCESKIVHSQVVFVLCLRLDGVIVERDISTIRVVRTRSKKS